MSKTGTTRRIGSSALTMKFTGAGSTPSAPTQFARAKLMPFHATETSSLKPAAAPWTAARPHGKLVRTQAMTRLSAVRIPTDCQWIPLRLWENSHPAARKTTTPRILTAKSMRRPFV